MYQIFPKFPTELERNYGEMLPGMKLLAQTQYLDSRGYFMPIIASGDNVDSLFDGMFRQINTAKSTRGVLRGMHRQGQSKLVYPLTGVIFDVALDVDTGKWFGATLTDSYALFIPPQYAHGYLVLSDTAVVQYIVDKPYDAKEEEIFRWDAYGIEWPLTLTPKLSNKDEQCV